MVKTFKVYLGPSTSSTKPSEGSTVYSCAHCRAHLAKHDNLISKSFQGSQGRAYLFEAVVNVTSGKAEERVLLTGLHSVADIKCECCRTVLGWKYETAYEASQKYKEGKYIIEVAHLIKDTNWDNLPISTQQCGSPTFSIENNSMFSSPSSSSPISAPCIASENETNSEINGSTVPSP